MIELSRYTKTYHPGEPNEVCALSGIDLLIARGEFVVVIGSNGSGKSTLLNSISGSVLPSSGDIRLNGIPVSHLPEYRRSKWVARVFQDPLKGTAPDLSIVDNFRLAALRTQSKTLRIGTSTGFRNEVAERIAPLGMGLETKLDRQVGSLSGGQRQALTLLMSVMDEASILLLDEPAAALDPRSAEVVMRIADDLVTRYSLTAMLVTHQLKDAFRYGNRLLFMEEGRIVRDLDAPDKAALKETELFTWFG